MKHPCNTRIQQQNTFTGKYIAIGTDGVFYMHAYLCMHICASVWVIVILV